MVSPNSGKDELVAFFQHVKEEKNANRSSHWFADLTVQARRAQLRLVPGGMQDGIGSDSSLKAPTSRRGYPWRP